MLRVSVIIPVLNEEAEITAAVTSAHDADADEIIVVDGGSTDRTLEILASLDATLSQPGVRGRAAQQNAGADQATGDVLLFLHADCRLPRDGIAEIKKLLSDSPETLSGCFQQEIPAKGVRYRLLEAGNLWRARVLKWAYGDQGIFVRADTFREISGFPDEPIMEDLLIMKKLKRKGRVGILRSRLKVSARRWDDRGVTLQTLRNWSFLVATHLGVSPARLVRFYPNVR